MISAFRGSTPCGTYRLPGGLLHAPYKLHRRSTFSKAVAAQCKQFTPLVGIDPDVFPQSVLLDITNVVHLFGGEAALVERILGELLRPRLAASRRRGRHARRGVGPGIRRSWSPAPSRQPAAG